VGTNSPEVANDTEASMRHRVREPRAGSRGGGRVHGIWCQRGEAVDMGRGDGPWTSNIEVSYRTSKISNRSVGD